MIAVFESASESSRRRRHLRYPSLGQFNSYVTCKVAQFSQYISPIYRKRFSMETNWFLLGSIR